MAPRPGDRYAALNRRATFDYFIEQRIECGLVLMGSEVKSIRQGHASINEAHAQQMAGEIWLFNAHVPTYKQARENHEERRPRKLLLHGKERNKLIGAIKREGIALIPIGLYFNDRGIAKLELGIAKGKKKQDKRASEKERDWGREKARVMRGEK
ncbi:SsrA-binding protein SmpB [Elstera cyanobacteriorum]|uniref:SsrA-binding protein n=1 Tax=Elstera cyanobacteriorum TaxID=2022747 RepID=A0A255Y081_9PROT|nr:SsrA-binding protein SmpB [Elstera cyanobacteriorum]MCK6444444.1 SsrA-binding protein SmpB [Elstera cyanobacteriorum]OYQ22035.1 SsrA-binding protein [Elstera cyanobacteriorum]GFZ80436.1 SsrA-binding protein [Elstera cyanobacteriorum]